MKLYKTVELVERRFVTVCVDVPESGEPDLNAECALDGYLDRFETFEEGRDNTKWTTEAKPDAIEISASGVPVHLTKLRESA